MINESDDEQISTKTMTTEEANAHRPPRPKPRRWTLNGGKTMATTMKQNNRDKIDDGNVNDNETMTVRQTMTVRTITMTLTL